MYHIRVEQRWIAVNPTEWCKSFGRCRDGRIPMIYTGKEDMTFDIFEGTTEESCAAVVVYLLWMKERQLIVFSDRPRKGQHCLN